MGLMRPRRGPEALLTFGVLALSLSCGGGGGGGGGSSEPIHYDINGEWFGSFEASASDGVISASFFQTGMHFEGVVLSLTSNEFGSSFHTETEAIVAHELRFQLVEEAPCVGLFSVRGSADPDFNRITFRAVGEDCGGPTQVTASILRQEPVDFTGQWSGHYESAQGPGSVDMDLVDDGATIFGVVVGEDEITGNPIAFSILDGYRVGRHMLMDLLQTLPCGGSLRVVAVINSDGDSMRFGGLGSNCGGQYDVQGRVSR